MRPGWAAPREATQKGRDQSIIFPRRRLDASQRGHEVTKGKGGKLNTSTRVFPTFANIQENGRTQGSMVMNERQNTIKLARARRQKQMAARRRRTSVANEFIQGIIDHKAFGLIMALFTVFALFGDDIRLAMCQKADDDVFFAISTVTLLAFFGELMLTHFARSDYTGGFYFWLDFVAMLSIIPDIGWIWEPLTGTGEGQGSDAGQEALKAGRASRAGTRAGRLVRIIRLVRLVRLVKLYKVTVGRDDEKRMKQRIREQPSKVGEKMSEMTTRRVIMMVLTLILILPFFDGGLEERINQFQAFGINRIHHMPQDMNVTGGDVGVSTEVFRLTVEQYAMFAGKLLYLEVHHWPRGVTDGWLREMSDAGNPDLPWRWGQLYPSAESITRSFRSNEVTFVSGTGCFLDGSGRQAVPGGAGPGGALPLGTECRSRAAFDKRSQSRAEATLNMVKTLFIMVVLSGGAMSFSRIAQTLVIGPIERMMKLVKMLARNPLASTTIHSSTEAGDWSAKAGYETLLLENTLAKIGALMQVGFGAAGAEIIGKNMGSGELDPMVPGKKIIAIYGFSDIRQFTDTTECLQEEVMVFVNKLGGIVHGSSHDYYGMANKNVGDAFLVSWKIGDGTLRGFSSFEEHPTEEARISGLEVRCPPSEGAGAGKRLLTPSELAESALTAFLRIIVDVNNANTDGCLTSYRNDPRVIERFGRDFKIRMGFGIHVGWAIEGAIGSAFKIDATYISPHVEMSDRLEASTKVFGVPLVMSEWFVGLLSPAARAFLRRLDCVKVRGCPVPFTVYTFDMTNFPAVFAEPRFDEYGSQIAVNFEEDMQYRQLQLGLSSEFFDTYNEGYNAYVCGQWEDARRLFERVLQIVPVDGPTKNLMDFMETTSFVPPRNWKGSRYMPDF